MNTSTKSSSVLPDKGEIFPFTSVYCALRMLSPDILMAYLFTSFFKNAVSQYQ